MAGIEDRPPPEQPIVLWRGFLGLCPACGKGKLFRSYLKQNDFCPACNANFSDIQADDGPGWFVMVLTGAIVVPAAVFLSIHDVMPEWAVLTLLVVLTLVVALLMLPRAKGIFIALLWRLARIEAASRTAGKAGI
jgi:uncharacterized protein (DUF983 family)